MAWRQSEVGAQGDPGRGYQAMIDYIKDQVGEGREYANNLVRVVLSERGCYYEFRDMPDEFSGAVGSGFRYQFMGTQEALALLQRVHDLVAAADSSDTREISLMVIYGWDGLFRREDAFIYHWLRQAGDDEGPVVVGLYRPQVLPLFFKLKIDSGLAEPVLGVRKGVLFFVANLSDQHLVVKIPHLGPDVTDLGEKPESRVVH